MKTPLIKSQTLEVCCNASPGFANFSQEPTWSNVSPAMKNSILPSNCCLYDKKQCSPLQSMLILALLFHLICHYKGSYLSNVNPISLSSSDTNMQPQCAVFNHVVTKVFLHNESALTRKESHRWKHSRTVAREYGQQSVSSKLNDVTSVSPDEFNEVAKVCVQVARELFDTLCQSERKTP